MIPLSREQRYLDKFIHFNKRVRNIDNWLSKTSNEMAKLATYKAIQELIVAITDVVAMLMKDLDLNLEMTTPISRS